MLFNHEATNTVREEQNILTFSVPPVHTELGNIMFKFYAAYKSDEL